MISLTSKQKVTFLCVLGLVTTAWAQKPVAESNEVATPLETRMKQTIVSVDFQEASMDDVITALSQQANIDIIKSPEVTGKVTAKLTDVPLDEALENILAVHGYGYVTTNSVIRIMPLKELQQQELKMVTKFYKLAYANINDVAAALQGTNSQPGILSKQGQMAVNKVNNELMVTDTDDRIAMIDRFIKEADQEIPQILVEARIYDLSCEDNQDLGFNWFAGTNTTYNSDTGLATGGQLNPFGKVSFSSNYNKATSGTGNMRFGILHNDLSLDATFKAVKDTVKARLLANPSILVLNNEEANINIVKEIPYQELTQTSAGGNIGTTRFKDVGVELTVRPRVTRDNKVRLAIHPVFSVHNGDVTITNNTTSGTMTSPQPIVDRREATTQALIENGQTVVIGGLRKSENQDQVSKVPVIGDLPLVGGLFRFHSKSAVTSELVVFITPRIIRDPNLNSVQQAQYNATQQAGRSSGQEPEAPATTMDAH